MDFERLRSPTAFLRGMLGVGDVPWEGDLEDYERWWREEGLSISEIVDRMGTPPLRMFDRWGNRVDEILYPPDYRRMLLEGYRRGIVARVFEENSPVPFYALGYVTAFFDAGLYCPYTVSLSTAIPLEKYGSARLKERYLSHLLRRDEGIWQGATWMTEAQGGSDLGFGVETVAVPLDGERWALTGEKYFASNAGAELAVVAARPEGAPPGVRGLALFLLPKYREDGSLNYFLRRLKDKIATRSVPTGEVELSGSEAFLLGEPEQGVYLILEVLNVSRVANSVGSVALLQRCLAEALTFAERRVAFGKPIVEHPLLRAQFQERVEALQKAFALAWEAVRLLDEVWRETPRYSERYPLFRLVAHLAKYWTAEQAVRTAKWAMEAHGGMGALHEYPVERWLREAMILAIWEGTPHRQVLDGLEAMERKQAHELLLRHLEPYADPSEGEALRARIEAHLQREPEEREAHAEGIFQELARFTAEALARKQKQREAAPPLSRSG